jgi:hypothetical protein
LVVYILSTAQHAMLISMEIWRILKRAISKK